MMGDKYKHIGYPKDKVIEEIGEVLQAIGKAERFGLFTFHPETKVVNIDQLRYEIDDLHNALDQYEKELGAIQRIKDAGNDQHT